MKKSLAVSSIFASIITLTCVFIYFGIFVTTNNNVAAAHATGYDLMFGMYHCVGLLVTWIIILVAFAFTFFGGVMVAMDKKAGAYLILLGALATLAAGCLTWFGHIFVANTIGNDCICGPAIAEGFNGVLLFISGLIALFSGFAAVGNNN